MKIADEPTMRWESGKFIFLRFIDNDNDINNSKPEKKLVATVRNASITSTVVE